jgi:hypothetical protein
MEEAPLNYIKGWDARGAKFGEASRQLCGAHHFFAKIARNGARRLGTDTGGGVEYNRRRN